MASLQARRRCLALVAQVWKGNAAILSCLESQAAPAVRCNPNAPCGFPLVASDGFNARGFASMPSAEEQDSVQTPVGRQYPAVGEAFRESAELEGGRLVLETGKLARLADAAVVASDRETKVLCTAIASRTSDPTQSFLPLTVDYREKNSAQGKIPGGHFRREGAPQTRELICSRLVDRAMRPLFPEGFFCETQLLANVLSLDGAQDPEVLAINGASAALTISEIPWNGPIGAVRIVRIDGKFVVDPGTNRWGKSDLSLIYAGTDRHCVMMDVEAKEITNEDLAEALRLAHREAQKLLEAQRRLAGQVNHRKRERSLDGMDEALVERIRDQAGAKISAILEDPSHGKQSRGKALADVESEVRASFEAAEDADAVRKLPNAFDELKWRIIRRNIIDRGIRPDHRPLDRVRDVYCEADFLPALHGASLFSRGNTQVVCTVTLGSEMEAMRMNDTMGASPMKRFMLHYSFPPYATNEVKRVGAVNRREVGHGMLAEKALAAVVPDDFPYTVRVTSECTASDGSSSMATVCGGSLALMDAGVPISKHVAGVSVGLFTDTDSDNNVLDYKLVTDIVGLEDHLGDMDFKVAGTRDGVTAIQLDMKLPGIPLEILIEGLDRARDARVQVIEKMEQAISRPREQPKQSHPRLAALPMERTQLSKVVGPLGATIKGIMAESGAHVSVEGGSVRIFARDSGSFDHARNLVETAAGREVAINQVYEGVVTSVRDYGALVEIDGSGGQEGLLHISEMADSKVKKVEDVVNVGDRIRVLCTGRNIRGDIRLSIKALNRADSSDSTDSEGFLPGSDEWQDSSSESGDGLPGTSTGESVRQPAPRISKENVEVGKTYRARVVSVQNYGAWLELESGEQGLLHVSQISHGFLSSVEDHVSIDQEIDVVVIPSTRDENGVVFSRIPLLGKPPRQTTISPIAIPGRRNSGR